MKNSIQRKGLAIMILIISLSSLVSVNVGATAYNKTYYNVVFSASQSADDAYYLIGYEFSNNSTYAYLRSSDYDSYTGFRFGNISIPTTAIIDNAYISLYGADAIDNKYYSISIKAINNVNSTGFNSAEDLYSITLLPNYINWDLKDLEGGKWDNSSDISILLSNIMNINGWVTNNSVSFRFDSAQTTTGTRSFRTYDYGSHEYAPKLYISYHVLTPITEDNPPNSIIDKYHPDVIELIYNDTETGYTTWKISNNTHASGFIYDNKWFNQSHGNNPITITNTWQVLNTLNAADKNRIVEFNGTYYTYMVRLTGGSYYLDIYKSTDRGETWNTYLTSIGGAHTLLEVALDIDPWGALAIFDGQITYGSLYYSVYNVTSNSYIKTRTSITGSANKIGEIYMGKTALTQGKLWFTISLTGVIYLYHHDAYNGAWTSTLLKNLNPYGSVPTSSEYWETSSGINAYVVYIDYSSDGSTYGVYGRYVHHDYTLETEQTSFVTGPAKGNGEMLSTARDADTGQIAIVWWNIYRYLEIKIRSDGPTGTWGNITELYHFNGGYPTASISFNTKYAPGIYTIIVRSEDGPDKEIKILSYNPIGSVLVTLGSYASTLGYAVKAFTFNTYYTNLSSIKYITVDEDGEIIIEGTTLPGPDDLPITATSIRYFLFTMGLILFLAPMILWSIGGEYRSVMGIGIGLIAMLTGLAFLMSITSIIL